MADEIARGYGFALGRSIPVTIVPLGGPRVRGFGAVLGRTDNGPAGWSVKGTKPLTRMMGSGPKLGLRNHWFGGNGQLKGVVTWDDTVAIRYRVKLFQQSSGFVVREVWSDLVTGAYSFDNIDSTLLYMVVVHDPKYKYRSLVANDLTAGLMP